CGSDLRRWREGPSSNAPATIPGHEIAGQIVQMGEQVRGYNTGDRIAVGPDVHCGQCFYCRHGRFHLCDHLILYGITPGYHGGLSQKMVVPHELLSRGICHVIPEGLSDEAASLAEPCSSVIACHQAAGTTLGEMVVIMGAGPIGCLHVAIAQSRGARVLVSEPNPVRRRMAEQFNPTAVIDPLQQDLKREVHRLTHGLGADRVICANPIASTHQQAVDIVRKGGEVVLFGGLPKAQPMTTMDANRIHYHEIRVVGSFSYHPTHHALALELLAQGVIPAEKVISAVYPLDQVQQAFEAAGAGSVLKIVIKP
ncbi:MAG: hypothetical protein EHM72_18625, partial [Calditrichaeota bacterium]